MVCPNQMPESHASPAATVFCVNFAQQEPTKNGQKYIHAHPSMTQCMDTFDYNSYMKHYHRAEM